MSYKIVACDLDGTLLSDDMTVSAENLRAIADLRAKGVEFVPASGRTLCEMDDALMQNPNVRYIIYSNGAAIFDKATGERTLFCMPNADVRFALDELRRYQAHVTFRHNGNTYADAKQNSEQSFAYHNVWQRHADVLRLYAHFLPDFYGSAYALDNVEVFAVFFRDVGEREQCFRVLEQSGKFFLAKICDNGLEIFSPYAGKGNALTALANKLHIPMEQTLAVGDSGNDITLLQAAGLGLAMSGSPEEVLAAADKTACRNNEHVVQHIIRTYF